MKYVVGCSPITSILYAGSVRVDGTWGANKKDVTNTAVSAVAQHLLQLNEKMQFIYKGKKYELLIKELNK